MAAGLPAETFWDQTPVMHEAIMRGARERETALAWQIAMFMRQDRLKPLGQYLAKPKRWRAQTAGEVLGMMRRFQAAGVPMKITKMKDAGNDGR